MHPLFIQCAKYKKVLRCVALRCISINSTRTWVVYIYHVYAHINIIWNTSSNHTFWGGLDLGFLEYSAYARAVI